MCVCGGGSRVARREGLANIGGGGLNLENTGRAAQRHRTHPFEVLPSGGKGEEKALSGRTNKWSFEVDENTLY